MLAFVDLEDRVPRDHPLRVAKRLVRFLSLRQVAVRRHITHQLQEVPLSLLLSAIRAPCHWKATSQAVVAAEAQR